jgi:F-type H+-transporting ATPase subunit b
MIEAPFLAGGIFQDTTFWVGVAFVLFVAAVVWKAGGKILAAIDARAAKIRTELDEAERLRDEAQKALADYQTRQREALAEAEQMLRQAEEEARRLRDKAEADLKASLARREKQALDRIAQAEAQAAADVRDRAVDIAIAATRKIMAERLDPAKAAALVDEAIKELPAKLN